MLQATTVNLEDFGGVGDGVTDDTIAIQAGLDYIASSGGTLVIDKPYFFSSVLSLVTPNKVNIQFESKGELIASSSLTGTGFWISGLPFVVDNAVYWDITQRVGGTTLSSDIAEGELSITVASASGLTKGSWIRIASTEDYVPTRPQYNKGELHQIQKVDGNVIYLDCSLFDSYTAVTSKVFPLIMPEVFISNLKMTGQDDENSARGITLWECQNVTLENPSVEGFNSICMDVEFCANVNITSPYANFSSKTYVTPNRTSYGLVIGSSQYVRVSGGTLKGGRHSFATGGYDPNRFLTVSGTVIMNNDVDSLDVAAMDSHENIDSLHVENCTIYGGADFGGQNVSVENCTILIADEVLSGLRFRPAKTCEYIRAINNNVTTTAESSGGIVIKHIADNVGIRNVQTTGNVVVFNTIYNRPAIGFEPQSVVAPKVELWECNDNQISIIAASGLPVGIGTIDQGTLLTVDVSVSNIHRNYVVTQRGRCVYTKYTNATGSLFMSDNIFIAQSNTPFAIQNASQVYLKDNGFYGSATATNQNTIDDVAYIDVQGGIVSYGNYNGIRYQNYTTLNEVNVRRQNVTVDNTNFTPTNTYNAHSWAQVSSAGALIQGYNCTVAKTGTGVYRITFTTRQRAADYVCIATVNDTSGTANATVNPLNYNACDVYTGGADKDFSFISF